jgi:hypothetical protein
MILPEGQTCGKCEALACGFHPYAGGFACSAHLSEAQEQFNLIGAGKVEYERFSLAVAHARAIRERAMILQPDKEEARP